MSDPRTEIASSGATVVGAPLTESGRFYGDLLLTFGEGSGSTVGRTRKAIWKRAVRGTEWSLQWESVAPGWRGFPLQTLATAPWKLWLLGELYGQTAVASIDDFLGAIAHGEQPAGTLNGHLVLFGWNEAEQRWHVWTDRFGTVHAYLAADGSRAAIGTCFRTVADAASRRHLDWMGLTGFFAFGFFPEDRTFFEDVRILRPASHYVFDETGCLLREERYWQWRHEPDRRRSYDDTVAEFGQVLGDVLADQTRDGRIAVPISGGLDSRTTVAMITRDDRRSAVDGRLWSYSYGYSEDSIETRIARQVASARGLPFQCFTIRPYLFDRLDLVLASVEGFQDVTQCRQAAVSDEICLHADYLIAAHWGDVWLDDMGLADEEFPPRKDEFVIDHALNKIAKQGREWLLKNLCQSQLNGREPHTLLRDFVRGELARVRDVVDADFQVKAFKTEQWSFRWTLASIRMYQAGAFPRLPFYDTRLTDFFATMPSAFVKGRRLQIDYLKRFAPDLARIPWQAYDTNLFWYPYFSSWLLPKRAAKKGMRILTGKRVIERNWEVQLLGEQGRQGLKQWLRRPGLLLHEFISPHAVEGLIEDFYAAPLEKGHGYTVSMLLTLSAWLECYGR